MQTATAPIVVSAAVHCLGHTITASQWLSCRQWVWLSRLSLLWLLRCQPIARWENSHTHQHKSWQLKVQTGPHSTFSLWDAASTRVQIRQFVDTQGEHTELCGWNKQKPNKGCIINNESQCHSNGHLNTEPEFNRTSASVSHGQENSSQRASKPYLIIHCCVLAQ